MKRLIIALFSVSVLLVGCASIFSGSTKDIKIRTMPDNATVTIFDQNNMKVWESSTPASVALKRGSGYFSGALYKIEISKSGYKTQVIQLTTSLNAGWYLLGNFLVGGLIGWLIVDPLTGAMWTINPDDINSQMNKISAYNKYDNSLCVVLRDQIPDEMFAGMNKQQIY